MDRKEAIQHIIRHMVAHDIGKYPHIKIGEALNMAIEALQEKERKWIPVSEKLPKEYETVIGVTDLNYYCIAVYCKQYGFRSMDVGVESDIIAWQPLPEPYKESEEE